MQLRLGANSSSNLAADLRDFAGGIGDGQSGCFAGQGGTLKFQAKGPDRADVHQPDDGRNAGLNFAQPLDGGPLRQREIKESHDRNVRFPQGIDVSARVQPRQFVRHGLIVAGHRNRKRPRAREV